MNVAQAVVDGLIAHGVETLYCLPGVQNDPFFDALFHRAERLRPVHTRHEQGAAYMALGAALATGRPQAFCVVPGPGLLNATAALATAYGCNAPVLALAGQIPSSAIGKGYGLLHEIPDQLGVLRGLTKWSARVAGPDASALLQEAFRRMTDGRTRPVGIEVPMDVWVSTDSPFNPTGRENRETEIDQDQLQTAAKILGAAERPLIMVGGGAQGASAEVRAVAEMLQAPVGAYRGGRGVLDSRHALSVSWPAAHRFWASADAVLAVGMRLQIPQQAWGLDARIKIVRVDIDPEEMTRIRPPAAGIAGDASRVLKKLLDAIPGFNRKRSSRPLEIQSVKDQVQLELHEKLAPQLAYLEAIRAALPENGIFVDELTQIGYASRLALPVYRPRTFLSSGYQGTLGWGLPAALGAKCARPEVPVLSVSGDGGFLFNVQELATAVRHRIAVVAVVFNDGQYGNVRMFQQQNFGGRIIASDLANPDFVKLAESFGVLGIRANSPSELRAALEKAFRPEKPVLIEVPCGEMPSPWPFIQMPRCRAPA